MFFGKARNLTRIYLHCYCLQVKYVIFFFSVNEVTGQVGFVVNEQEQDGDDTKPVPVFRPIDIRKQMTSVACGKEHALLLTSLGVVYSLGSGR